MTNITNIQDNTNDFTVVATQVIKDKISEIADNLYTTSKEKYDHKAKLIDNASDMTTQQKLDAYDQNYEHYNQEIWQSILIFGVVTLGLIGLASCNPTIIKNARRFVA